MSGFSTAGEVSMPLPSWHGPFAELIQQQSLPKGDVLMGQHMADNAPCHYRLPSQSCPSRKPQNCFTLHFFCPASTVIGQCAAVCSKCL